MDTQHSSPSSGGSPSSNPVAPHDLSAKIPAVRTLEGDAARFSAVHSGGNTGTSAISEPVHIPVASSDTLNVGAELGVPRDDTGALVVPDHAAGVAVADETNDLHPAHAAVPHKPSRRAAVGAVNFTGPATAQAEPPIASMQGILDEIASAPADFGAPEVSSTGAEAGKSENPLDLSPGGTPAPSAPAPVSSVPAPSAGDMDLMKAVAEIEPNAVHVEEEVPIPDQIAKLESDLKDLAAKRKSIEEHTAKLFVTRRTVEDTLAPILSEAKGIAAELAKVEEAEKRSAEGGAERRGHERKRWEIVEKMRGIDERKWKVRENLDAVLADIKQEEENYKQFGDEEQSVKDRIEKLHIEAKRREFKAELDKITEERGSVESKLGELDAERSRVEQLLKDTQSKETSIESEEADTAKKLAGAKTLGEERMLADARYRLEKERHDIEEARWKTEDDIKHVRGDIGESEVKLKEIKRKEEEVKKKLAELG